MIVLATITLEGHGIRLEPLTPAHREGLATAAADGRLWELWFTSVWPDVKRHLATRLARYAGETN